MKMLLGDFNAKVGREGIFKPTIGNENLHKANNDSTTLLNEGFLRVCEKLMYCHTEP
jgi:hypothetical protein